MGLEPGKMTGLDCYGKSGNFINFNYYFTMLSCVQKIELSEIIVTGQGRQTHLGPHSSERSKCRCTIFGTH